MNKFYKRILACLVFSISLSFTNAQWVTIPDANFVTFLQQNFAGCMNGNLMDTTCSSIVNAITVDCSSKGISNLSGIRYFDNLKILHCYNNQLASLPVLPASLKELWCNINLLTSLPTLPTSLENLDCDDNQLTSLPVLPVSLKELRCYANLLSSLPTLSASLTLINLGFNQFTSLPSLPSSLLTLYCWNNQLTNLPVLPSSLMTLDCNSNFLTSLPALPSSLTSLNCYHNQLTSLTALPSSLTSLNCNNNQLTSLPSLPSSLNYLYCHYNQLTSLPPLPASLTTLYCYGNQLTTLPTLPTSLKELRCSNNQITCLPTIPSSLQTLLGSNAGYSCLPNKPVTLTTITGPSTICSQNQAVIIPAGPIAFCTGGSVTLNANTATGLTYQWMKNGTNIVGATSSSYVANASGSYTIVETGSTGCVGTASAAVVVTLSTSIPAIPASISATGGNTKVCPGDTKIYTCSTVSGASYTWTPPVGATITSGQGTKTVTVNFTAAFTASDTLRVIAVNGCGSSAQRKLKITRNTPSTPGVITGSAFGVCNLSNVPYSITNTAGITYNWSFSIGTANVNSGQGSNAITANFGAGYVTGSLRVNANNACGTSANRTLSIKATPTTPTSITGATTVCANQQGVPYSISPITSATTYTWSAPTGSHVSDGTTTSSGTNLTTTATNVTVNYGSTAGKINARANNACGSGAYKNITVSFTCRESAQTNSFNGGTEVIIQPNPSTGIFEMMIPSTENKNTEIEIYFPDGRLIKKQIVETNNSFTIDLTEQADGIYFIQTLIEGKLIFKKVVKQ